MNEINYALLDPFYHPELRVITEEHTVYFDGLPLSYYSDSIFSVGTLYVNCLGMINDDSPLILRCHGSVYISENLGKLPENSIIISGGSIIMNECEVSKGCILIAKLCIDCKVTELLNQQDICLVASSILTGFIPNLMQENLCCNFIKKAYSDNERGNPKVFDIVMLKPVLLNGIEDLGFGDPFRIIDKVSETIFWVSSLIDGQERGLVRINKNYRILEWL